MRLSNFFILIFLIFYCDAHSPVLHAIIDLIPKFFSGIERNLDLIVYGKPSFEIKDLLDGILNKRIENKTIMLRYFSEPYSIHGSSIILFSRKKDISYFLNKHEFDKKIPSDLKVLIYCTKLDTLSLDIERKKIKDIESQINQITYFLEISHDIIFLNTFQWFFNDQLCDFGDLYTVGIFIIKDLVWTKLKLSDKYGNFHKCELVFGSLIESNVFFRYTYETDSFDGVFPDMVEIFSKYFNFTPFYQPIKLLNHGKFINGSQYGLLKLKNKNIKNPHINMKQNTLYGLSINIGYSVLTNIQIQYIFAITPGELYTSYEKLSLPFDLTTWIFLIFTFFSVFSLISIFNLASRNVKDLIYGKNIKHPALNVVSIFFGIALKKIAKENASRILLILFIWFCLIFRTCYQSKMFEFMTNEIRKPSPQTINELFEQNFTIITQDFNLPLLLGVEDSKRSTIKVINKTIFNEILNSFKLYNANEKLAILTSKEGMKVYSIDNSIELQKNMEVLILKEEFCTLAVVFSLHSKFFFKLFFHVFEQLIPAGIPQHSYAYHKFLMADRKKLRFEKEPEVLTVQDLSFGFVIWLIVLSTSFLVLFCEIIVHKLNKKLVKEENKVIKVKFAKVHPIIEKNSKENNKIKINTVK
ncbi:hypothetical protein PVAND_002374 [Polypedilum vanderplanki]|uniref:Ionotropic receptor n=1 Tax=Polypedilum vanderplanki TaxID=319348 RepID=A0A9J6BR95_POLVA|nr:hypothetical protein PVAND_002374 [Polypedilum vanderplanki]